LFDFLGCLLSISNGLKIPNLEITCCTHVAEKKQGVTHM